MLLTRAPNQEFAYALIDALQQGFRARRNEPAEMIAKYLDRAMRKGQKGKENAAFLGKLDRVLVLYRCMGEKELSVSLYQAIIFLLFNDTEEIAFGELKTLTRMGASPPTSTPTPTLLSFLSASILTLTSKTPADDTDPRRTL